MSKFTMPDLRYVPLDVVYVENSIRSDCLFEVFNKEGVFVDMFRILIVICSEASDDDLTSVRLQHGKRDVVV